MSQAYKKWISFNNWSKKGPYLILILDYEWWDSNQKDINEWFDHNCPFCKPAKSDTIIRFSNQTQYVAWCMTWI
jgi:hypothetical protein